MASTNKYIDSYGVVVMDEGAGEALSDIASKFINLSA